jgi:YD repeat-containing protein
MKALFHVQPPRIKRATAFTLMEVMITLGIATLFVTGLIIFTTITFQQGIFAIGNYTDLNTKSRRTLDLMSRDIRSAAGLDSYTTNSITLTNPDGTKLKYAWDGGSALTRTFAGQSSVLMSNCDYLCFNIYKRNPTNNFNFVPATSQPNETKLIDVSWRCSRSYVGQKLNTESVQTARIVMRN